MLSTIDQYQVVYSEHGSDPVPKVGQRLATEVDHLGGRPTFDRGRMLELSTARWSSGAFPLRAGSRTQDGHRGTERGLQRPWAVGLVLGSQATVTGLPGAI